MDRLTERIAALCRAGHLSPRDAQRLIVEHEYMPETFLDNSALWFVVGAACMAIIAGVTG